MATPEPWENVTPNWGIRYPKPTAPAQKLPDAFGHMGTDLDDALTRGSLPSGPDTGWVGIVSIATGWTADGTPAPATRKLGEVSYSRGIVRTTAAVSVGSTPVRMFNIATPAAAAPGYLLGYSQLGPLEVLVATQSVSVRCVWQTIALPAGVFVTLNGLFWF